MTRGRNRTQDMMPESSDIDISASGLSEDGRRIVAAIRDDFNKLKKDLLQQLSDKSAQIDSLNDEVKNLKMTVSKMESKIDDADAYERRDTLIISGEEVPVVTPGENCTDIVGGLIKNKLKLSVAPRDVSTAHRQGKKPNNQQADKRNLIVKFYRRDLKKDILTACRRLKPALYFNESLTPLRSSILYVLRQAKKKSNRLVGCSSVNGRIFAWIKAEDDTRNSDRDLRLPINSHVELQTFCNDVLHEPLSNYLPRWPH